MTQIKPYLVISVTSQHDLKNHLDRFEDGRVYVLSSIAFSLGVKKLILQPSFVDMGIHVQCFKKMKLGYINRNGFRR